MGEIVEIICVLKGIQNVLEIYKYIKMADCDEKSMEEISIIDNWSYENVYCLSSFDECALQKLTENKIVLITETRRNGQRGMTVEALANDLYSVELWYNHAEKDVWGMLDPFLQSMPDAVISCLEVIAAGKETLFIYNSSFIQMVKAAHNIEIWVVPEVKICEKSDEELEEYHITRCTVKGNQMLFIVPREAAV